jgi:hypothetical protein
VRKQNLEILTGTAMDRGLHVGIKNKNEENCGRY